MGAITRPAILTRVAHHLGAHGIELDVTVAGEHVLFALGEAGAKASFPEGAAATVAAIDILHVALPEMLHHQARAFGLLRRDWS